MQLFLNAIPIYYCLSITALPLSPLISWTVNYSSEWARMLWIDLFGLDSPIVTQLYRYNCITLEYNCGLFWQRLPLGQIITYTLRLRIHELMAINKYIITGVYQRNPITALHSNFLTYKPMNSLNLCVDFLSMYLRY